MQVRKHVHKYKHAVSLYSNVTVTINEGAYKAIKLFFFKCDMKISAAYILFISTSITQAYYC